MASKFEKPFEKESFMTITTPDQLAERPYNDGGIVPLSQLPPHLPLLRIESMEGDIVEFVDPEPFAAFRRELLGTFTIEQAEPSHLSVDDVYAAITEARQAILDAPSYAQAQRIIDEQQRQRTFVDHYCYCSPGRGMFFDRDSAGRRRAYIDRLMEWPEPVIYTSWVPEPEPVPVMSKELVVIPKPVLDPVEIIPAPKVRAPKLALLGCSMIAVLAFVADVAAAFIH